MFGHFSVLGLFYTLGDFLLCLCTTILGKIWSVFVLQFESGFCGRGEIYDADREAPQKSYEDEEEGKLVPHRYLGSLVTSMTSIVTFLT